jgi:ankyrin repeat protein
MLLIIQGTIFHDEVGHWPGYRSQFALSTYSRIDDTFLHKAVDANYPHVIEFLVRNGLNLESKNSLWITPLSWAANAHPESTRKTVVEKLLLLGANPNTKDKHGFTPMDCAAYHKSNEAVCDLFEKLW